MIEKLSITVETDLINKALASMPSFDFRVAINEPTGDFFYDPWKIKQEFRGTIWETLLSTLPYQHGEARIVNLTPRETYLSHADVDDRWHLPLTNEKSYLIDLETETMYPCTIGEWHSMDAGSLHTAANFGSTDRIHLLVRKLLTQAELTDPIKYIIQAKTENLVPHRYIFDEVYSPILNKLNKENKLADFVKNETSVEFKTERDVFIPGHKDFLIKL